MPPTERKGHENVLGISNSTFRVYDVWLYISALRRDLLQTYKAQQKEHKRDFRRAVKINTLKA